MNNIVHTYTVIERFTGVEFFDADTRNMLQANNFTLKNGSWTRVTSEGRVIDEVELINKLIPYVQP